MSQGGRVGILAALRRFLVGPRPAGAGHVRLADAPAAWADYARLVSAEIGDALDGAQPAAQRLHSAAVQCSPANDGSMDQPYRQSATRLMVWLDGRGRIEAIQCVPSRSQALEADLQAVLMGRRMGSPPPRGMRQPIVVLLTPEIAFPRHSGAGVEGPAAGRPDAGDA